MTPGSHLAAELPLVCNRSPCFLNPASPKPGETNTVTPSWQVPLGTIRFPRETGTQLNSCAKLPYHRRPNNAHTLATVAVPSLWFVTTITVQCTARKGVLCPKLLVRKRKGKGVLGKGRVGVKSALQSGRPPLSASFVTGFRGLSLDVLFVDIGASWQNPVLGSAHGAMS